MASQTWVLLGGPYFCCSPLSPFSIQQFHSIKWHHLLHAVLLWAALLCLCSRCSLSLLQQHNINNVNMIIFVNIIIITIIITTTIILSIMIVIIIIIIILLSSSWWASSQIQMILSHECRLVQANSMCIHLQKLHAWADTSCTCTYAMHSCNEPDFE